MVKPDTAWAGKNLIYEEQVDSTNEVAKRAGDLGQEHGTLFMADRQTAGKGRRGRGWYSEPEGNLYFTILLRPQILPDKAAMLTLIMALAVAEAIKQGTGLEAMIKWPNDIVVNDKKVCGILSEMKLAGMHMEYCVVGVGINVGQKHFAEDIQDKASSLELETDCMVSRENLLERILYSFEKAYEQFLETEDLAFLQGKYNTLLINKDKQVRVMEPKGEYEGIARGITTTGELLVELPDKSLQRIYAGEVSVRGLYGYV